MCQDRQLLRTLFHTLEQFTAALRERVGPDDAGDRLKLVREDEVRETPAGPVSFKIGSTTSGEKLKEKAEFGDLEKVWETDPDFEP